MLYKLGLTHVHSQIKGSTLYDANGDAQLRLVFQYDSHNLFRRASAIQFENGVAMQELVWEIH